MASSSPQDELGVAFENSASHDETDTDELVRLLKKLVKQLHPDTSGDKYDQVAFGEASEALKKARGARQNSKALALRSEQSLASTDESREVVKYRRENALELRAQQAERRESYGAEVASRTAARFSNLRRFSTSAAVIFFTILIFRGSCNAMKSPHRC